MDPTVLTYTIDIIEISTTLNDSLYLALSLRQYIRDKFLNKYNKHYKHF